MSYNRYDTVTVLDMIEEIEVQNSFFTNMFFSDPVFFETGQVEFDIRTGGKRVAPFVSPLVAGVPIDRHGYVTKSMKPAYIKIKSNISPTDALTRTAGEGYNNQQMTPSQRMDALMGQELGEHDSMISNRIEWMAVNTILNGGYAVNGEDYQSQYVDFQHSPTLQGALAGAAVWSADTSSPLDDIEQYALAVRRESKGAIVDTIIMDSLAWQYFRKHADVKDRLNTDIRRLNVTNLDDGIRNDIGLYWVANIDGRFSVYVYDDFLTDDDGNDVPLMPDNTVIIASQRAMQGRQYYGAILDSDANFQALRMYSKSRSSWDPTGEELLTQSAPLVAPARGNTWAILNVA